MTAGRILSLLQSSVSAPGRKAIQVALSMHTELFNGGKGGQGDEMVGWHHQLNGHEFEQTPGDSEGQGSLACCSPQGHKEWDTTEQLNNNKNNTLSSLSWPYFCLT